MREGGKDVEEEQAEEEEKKKKKKNGRYEIARG